LKRLRNNRRSKSKLKWGVAGCGRFAELAFIPTLSLLRKNKLISVFSNDLSRSKSIAEKFGVPNYFNNYDEFLKSDINCVYVSSVNAHHYDQVIKAAKAGKNILCEKPLALTSDEANEMIKVCEDNNVILTVSYVYRFHPLILKAKEFIDGDMLGKIVSINLNYNTDYAPGNNFRFNRQLSGGGSLRDIGTHLIDLLRFFGGEITEIKGVVDNIIYKSEVDDFASAIVKFKESGYGYFNVSFNVKRAFNRIEILCHRGALSIENFIGVKNVPAKLTILLDGEAKKAFRKRGNKLYFLLKSVQKSFLKKEPLLVTGYDGYINLKLMEELESQCQSERN